MAVFVRRHGINFSMSEKSPIVPTILLASPLEGLTTCAFTHDSIIQQANRKCGYCGLVEHDRCKCPTNKDNSKFLYKISIHRCRTTDVAPSYFVFYSFYQN